MEKINTSKACQFKDFQGLLFPAAQEDHADPLTALFKNELRSANNYWEGNYDVTCQEDWERAAGPLLEGVDRYGAVCITIKSGVKLIGNFLVSIMHNCL